MVVISADSSDKKKYDDLYKSNYNVVIKLFHSEFYVPIDKNSVYVKNDFQTKTILQRLRIYLLYKIIVKWLPRQHSRYVLKYTMV